MDVPMPQLSHHLHRLRRTGLVRSRRLGRSVLHELADSGLQLLLPLLDRLTTGCAGARRARQHAGRQARVLLAPRRAARRWPVPGAADRHAIDADTMRSCAWERTPRRSRRSASTSRGSSPDAGASPSSASTPPSTQATWRERSATASRAASKLAAGSHDQPMTRRRSNPWWRRTTELPLDGRVGCSPATVDAG